MEECYVSRLRRNGPAGGRRLDGLRSCPLASAPPRGHSASCTDCQEHAKNKHQLVEVHDHRYPRIFTVVTVATTSSPIKTRAHDCRSLQFDHTLKWPTAERQPLALAIECLSSIIQTTMIVTEMYLGRLNLGQYTRHLCPTRPTPTRRLVQGHWHLPL